MSSILILYTSITDPNSFHGLISCTIFSVAVLITGFLSYTRPQWLLERFDCLTPTTQIGPPPQSKSCLESMEAILRYLRSIAKSPIIPSPEKTLLPELTVEEQSSLAYHPSSLPGGRWLNTPACGRVRVYEFGPENGRRVLFVHGISTPSIVARDMLLDLARRGCRVLVFDLPGRGYSECCSKTPQDMRLYAALILMVATSSTAPGSFFPFNLLGYSLGGGIAVAFASQFPHLVSSLAVFSSGGLLPLSQAPLGLQFSMLPWTPVWLAERLLTSELKGEEENPAGDIPLEYLQGDTLRTNGMEPLDIFAVMKWQNRHHRGFMPGFVNSMRHAPVFDGEKEWCEVGRLFKEGGFAFQEDGKRPKKMLVMYGEHDELTPPSLLGKIKDVVGKEHVTGLVVNGGKHEIVVYQWETIVAEIFEHWRS